jgi:predicted nucleic acid-binding protein
MITYLDTSSLVKLYVEEKESIDIEKLVASSEVVSTSIVAYAEARAAFARRYREKAFTPKEYNRIKEFFEQDWSNYLVLILSGDMTRNAGNLAEKHALRGFDSIHLAAAITLSEELSNRVAFSCFDESLRKAAKREGLDVH